MRDEVGAAGHLNDYTEGVVGVAHASAIGDERINHFPGLVDAVPVWPVRASSKMPTLVD
ncbi:hypothetical protein AB0953_31970 [Streptomyces sp. NPDC046866]|uniref:hypothetical protein n=1 Tax=Streptomyces sp. NPDC046866 TaxID=3154921 RepID=UPI0034532915